MKVKGTFVSQMSGKLGGFVASAVKGGTQVFRRRPSTAKTPSVLQIAVRAALANLSQLWSNTLTATQRAQWTTYSQNVTKKNGFGDTITVSGQGWFVGNNLSRSYQNGSVADLTLQLAFDGPSTFNLGDPTLFAPGNIGVDVVANNATLVFNGSLLPISAQTGSQDAILIYVSTPFSAGRVAPPGPYNLVAAYDANSTVSSHHITLPANLAINATASSQLWVARLSRLDGRLSSAFTFPANS